nr:Chain B, G protein-activated inward rectifier potassium channel 3 [Homo sapiens]
LPPPESESKV